MDDIFENVMNYFWPVRAPEDFVMPIMHIDHDPTDSGLPPLITVEQLRKVMTRLSVVKATEYLPFLSSAMQEFLINTSLRISAFIAQISHESSELRYFEELGRESYFTKYDGRKDLGNTIPGDGYRYRGRGPIQLTGRLNYRTAGRILKIDLENNPDLASTPEVAFRISALFWKGHGLNELADVSNFKKITFKINGGYRGFPERQKYYQVALSVFA